MSLVASLTDPTLSKIRAILALEGIAGQAGEVSINLMNQAGASRLFQSAAVSVEGAYSVTVTTDDTFHLTMRSSGELTVEIGPGTGTMARFAIGRVDGFEYQLSRKETRYIFSELRPTGETRLAVTIHW